MKDSLKKFLRPLYLFILSVIDNIRLRIDYRDYIKRKEIIKSVISEKRKIRVVFFVYAIGMWKNDNLFRLLQSNERFEPIIVPLFVITDREEANFQNQEAIKQYCGNRGFPYLDLQNPSTGEWLNIEGLHPDVVLYQQPYGSPYKRYDIKALWNNCLFYYIPYNMVMEKTGEFVNTLLFNISQRVFAPSSYHVKEWSKLMYNKGNNLVVSGFPTFDFLTDKTYNSDVKWKIKDPKIKRIIWAPHHSILDKGILHYSNFIRLAEEMKNLAVAYNGAVQFAFKPHPRLRASLERYPGWGKEKTDEYYKWWEDSPNTTFVNGEYYDLFLSSDAMIHDCSTFMAEYLYTQKPVFFIIKPNYKMPLTDFAKECMNNHYQGSTVESIKTFIDSVVIDGKDEMYSRRLSFVEKTQLRPTNMSVADKIGQVISDDLLN